MKKDDIRKIVEGISFKAVQSLSPEVQSAYDVRLNFEKNWHQIIFEYELHIKELEVQNNKYDKGSIDTFMQASCMCKALLCNKIISFKFTTDIPQDLLLINYQIAFDVACEMIKLPEIYGKVHSKWCKIEAKALNKIIIPDGIIPDSPLRLRIIQSMALEDVGPSLTTKWNEGFSIWQFANLLHTIYLLSLF